MAKLQHRSLKIIGTTPEQAYEKYNILPIVMYMERSCTTTVDRILNDPSHPLTKSQNELPQPKHYTRNSQIRIKKAKTAAYVNSCLQIVLRMKRDGYRDKYTKPRRKETTTVEYTTQKYKKRKKQSRSQPTKMLKKGNIDLSTRTQLKCTHRSEKHT